MKSQDVTARATFAVQGSARFVALSGAETLPTSEIRGQEYVIVPCSMLVEGVLHSSNASDPALALASEFGAIPQGWDGRPVVYNHPSVDGQAVSANRPDGWNNEVIGYIFNTRLDGKKLLSDLWLDTSRAPATVLDGLKAGDEFEVSTGLFALPEEVSGFFNNERYSQIWRNVVPDHLAVLEPGSIGACSIADGCGTPRMNSGLTTNARIYMSAAQTQGSDISHLAANAKADETAASPGDCGCSGSSDPKSWMNRLPKAIQLAANKFLSHFKTNELSDRDVRSAIALALQELEGYAYASVEAVFSTTVVFSAMDREDYDWHMYQVSYTVAEGGAISLGANPVEVRPETSFVPVVVTGATAENDANLTNSSSKGIDMELSKEQLAALATQVADQLRPAPAATAVVTELVVANSSAAAKLATIDDVVANATPELAANIKAAVSAQEALRTNAVKQLVTNGYTEAELAGLPLGMLNKMLPTPVVAVNGSMDYSAGAGAAVTTNKAVENFTAPTRVFPLKAA